MNDNNYVEIFNFWLLSHLGLKSLFLNLILNLILFSVR